MRMMVQVKMGMGMHLIFMPVAMDMHKVIILKQLDII